MARFENLSGNKINGSRSISSMNPRSNRSQNSSASSLFDKLFQDQEIIGRGSFGEVYSANWSVRKQEVALKKVELKSKVKGLVTFYKSLKQKKPSNYTDHLRAKVRPQESAPQLASQLAKSYHVHAFTKQNRYSIFRLLEAPEEMEKRTREEMEHEIRTWQKIKDHEFILNLFDSFFVGNQCWLVMELCNGGNLYYYVKNFVDEHMIPFTLDIVLEFFTPIISAIKYMHSKGIIHRDIKPENIIMTSRMEPRIADFGLCCEFSGGTKSKIKHEHSFSGTPSYAPPEAFFGQTINATWDSWSLACSMLFMKFGKVPWILGGKSWPDEEISEFFSVKCKGLANESFEDAEKEYLNEMHVLPKNFFIQQNSKDDFQWCEKRLAFGEFLKRCMSWDQEKRFSPEEMLESEYFKERFEFWEACPKEAAKKLQNKIEEWIEDDTFIEDKWYVF